MNSLAIRRLLATAAVTVALGSMFVSPALAQDAVPASGDFELRYTWVNPTTSDFGLVDQSTAAGDVAEAGAWIAWLMRNDGSEGFGHKMTGRCIGMTRQNAEAGYTLVVGNCVYTDADGDKLYESYDGLTATWVEGTGKYEGISGGADLTDIFITFESGYMMMSGVKIGSYTID